MTRQEMYEAEVLRYVSAVANHKMRLAHIRWNALCRLRGWKYGDPDAS